LTLLLLITAQELGDEVKDPAAGWSVRFPNSFKVTHQIRGKQVQARGEKGAFVLERAEFLEPQTFARLLSTPLEWLKKDQEGHEVVAKEEITVAGFRAHRLHTRWKGTSTWRYFIRLSPYEVVSLEAHWPQEDEKAGAESVAKVAGSIVITTPEEPPESGERVAGAVGLLKEAKVPASRLATRHLAFAVDGVDISKLKITIAEATVSGRAGYSIDSLSSMVNKGGGSKQTDVVRASFLMDGSWQKAEWERTVEENGQKHLYKATALIEKGKCTISRALDTETESASLDAGPGTYLDIISDEARAAMAMKGKALLAQRIVHFLGRNRAVVELADIADLERMRLGGAAARPLRVVSSQLVGLRHRTFIYEEDGRLASYRYPAARGESRAITAEEYDRIKLPGE
jgi:hypothetical protein